MRAGADFGRTAAVALLVPYALALIIFIMVSAYVFKMGIVVTVGRVSLIGFNVYLFTGSVLLDRVFFWMLMLFSSAALGSTLRSPLYRFLLLALTFLGFVTTSATSNELLFALMGSASTVAVFVAVVRSGLIRELAYSFLLVVAVLEAVKLLYLSMKLVAGFYPAFLAAPVYVNTVVWYYLWLLAPISLAVVAVCGASKAVLRLLNMETTIRSGIVRLYAKIRSIISMRSAEDNPMPGGSTIYLLIGLALSVAMGLIPYAPTLNPGQRPVNVDWVYYYSWLKQMAGGDFSVLLTRSDRPLYLLLLYTAWRISGVDLRALALYHNVALLPLYTFSLYLLAKRWLGERAAGYTALLAPFSPIFLSFIYGGFQANLFAVSLVYLSLYLLAGSRRGASLGLAILFMAMFIHEWTWTQYTFVLTGYAALRLIGRALNRWSLEWRDKAIMYYLVAGYLADISKNTVFNMFSAARVVEAAINANTMPYIDGLHFYTTIYTGGTLNNSLFYVMVLLGIGSLGLDIPSLATILSLIPALAPWSDITYRLILNTPITALAAEGMARQRPLMRVLLMVSLAGVALWRLYTIIPGLSLTP